jgi:hypothetical protein
MARRLTPKQRRVYQAEKQWKAYMRYFNNQRRKTCTAKGGRYELIKTSNVEDSNSR